MVETLVPFAVIESGTIETNVMAPLGTAGRNGDRVARAERPSGERLGPQDELLRLVIINGHRRAAVRQRHGIHRENGRAVAREIHAARVILRRLVAVEIVGDELKRKALAGRLRVSVGQNVESGDRAGGRSDGEQHALERRRIRVQNRGGNRIHPGMRIGREAADGGARRVGQNEPVSRSPRAVPEARASAEAARDDEANDLGRHRVPVCVAHARLEADASQPTWTPRVSPRTSTIRYAGPGRMVRRSLQSERLSPASDRTRMRLNPAEVSAAEKDERPETSVITPGTNSIVVRRATQRSCELESVSMRFPYSSYAATFPVNDSPAWNETPGSASDTRAIVLLGTVDMVKVCVSSPSGFASRIDARTWFVPRIVSVLNQSDTAPFASVTACGACEMSAPLLHGEEHRLSRSPRSRRYREPAREVSANRRRRRRCCPRRASRADRQARYRRSRRRCSP